MKVRLISSDSTTDLTQGTDYNVSDRVVTLTNPTSLKIQIYRETTTKPLVGWADASVLRAADMTVQSTQLLHLSEETMDKVQDGGLAQDTNDGVWDARYNRIKNLLDPKEPGDAVTLSYIVANQTSLLNALKATGKEQNDSIVATGNTQNIRLTTTGDTQNKRLVATGDAQYNRLISTGNTQNTRLTTTGDTQDKRLNDLGNKYVNLLTQIKEEAKLWDPTQYVTKAAANQLLRNKSYAVGDIAYSPNLPSYLYLECITAGTTGATEPNMSTIKSGG